MKTHKNLFSDMVLRSTVKRAIRKAAEGKMDRRDVKEVMEHEDDYIDAVIEMLVSHSYVPAPYKKRDISEGSRHKHRTIEIPEFIYDQLIQNCLITQLEKVVLPHMYEHAHGSLKGRGQSQTAKLIRKWIKRDKRGTRYCLQMDIHHCYPSIDKELLIAKYHEKIKDDDFNIENDKVIRAGEHGLAIGSPTSFWHLHFLLTPIDHWIVTLDGVKHYVRHADDMIIFGSNKRKLHRVEWAVIERVREELHLEINYSHQVFPLEYVGKDGRKHGRPLDVCGFLFYRDRTILRESRMLGVTRKAARIGKKDKPTIKDARQMISQMGWLDHSDTYDMYLEYVKPKVSKRKMRKIISKYDRRKNGIQKSGKLPGDKARGDGHHVVKGESLSEAKHQGSAQPRP